MSSCLAEFCIGESGSLWARRHGLGGRILSSSKLQLAVCWRRSRYIFQTLKLKTTTLRPRESA